MNNNNNTVKQYTTTTTKPTTTKYSTISNSSISSGNISNDKQVLPQVTRFFILLFSVTNVQPLVVKPTTAPVSTGVSNLVSKCPATIQCMSTCENGYTLGSEGRDGCPACTCIDIKTCKWRVVMWIKVPVKQIYRYFRKWNSGFSQTWKLSCHIC